METETEPIHFPLLGFYQRVTREQLQAIVQQAYDQHGILAEPSYQLEAARTTGLCPCGQPACSDGGQS